MLMDRKTGIDLQMEIDKFKGTLLWGNSEKATNDQALLWQDPWAVEIWLQKIC